MSIRTAYRINNVDLDYSYGLVLLGHIQAQPNSTMAHSEQVGLEGQLLVFILLNGML